MAPDEGFGADTESDLLGSEVGIDGGAASAEEAAVHVIDEDDPSTTPTELRAAPTSPRHGGTVKASRRPST